MSYGVPVNPTLSPENKLEKNEETALLSWELYLKENYLQNQQYQQKQRPEQKIQDISEKYRGRESPQPLGRALLKPCPAVLKHSKCGPMGEGSCSTCGRENRPASRVPDCDDESGDGDGGDGADDDGDGDDYSVDDGRGGNGDGVDVTW